MLPVFVRKLSKVTTDAFFFLYLEIKKQYVSYVHIHLLEVHSLN